MRTLERRVHRIETKVDRLSKSVQTRFRQVDRRFEQVDRRFEQVDRRFAEAQRRSDERFERMDRKFGVMHENLRDLIGQVAEGVVMLGERIDRVQADLTREILASRAELHAFIRVQTETNRRFERRFEEHDARLGALERRSGA